jgi:hypothetical protein
MAGDPRPHRRRRSRHGLPLSLQASTRGIGVILGLDTSFHPLMGFPGYHGTSPALPPGRACRGPARAAAQGTHPGETSGRLAGDGSAHPAASSTCCSRASS